MHPSMSASSQELDEVNEDLCYDESMTNVHGDPGNTGFDCTSVQTDIRRVTSLAPKPLALNSAWAERNLFQPRI